MHAPTKLQALDELRKGKQWVCFDKSKVPINPFTLRNAMSNKPGTWETYDVAETVYKADKERFLIPISFLCGKIKERKIYSKTMWKGMNSINGTSNHPSGLASVSG